QTPGMPDRSMEHDRIIIRGAREHNLRNVHLELPRNALIVFTGVSGSGKSSLAFDTLYAEGQRRYIESLSSYARQFLGQLPKPDVDYIAGLSPSVSIQQKTAGRNPRSTVGTITEVYDFLRVLYARLALDAKIRPRLAEAVESALALAAGAVVIAIERTGGTGHDDLLLSAHYACTHCDISYEEPTPQLFSFNSPHGMCPECDGLGNK